MRSLFLLFVFGGLLLTGCAGQKAVIAEQAETIDSLYTLERSMRADLYALQDSIRFYDDLDSGQYFRERRSLQARIDRLEYLVAVRRDSLCAAPQAEPVASIPADDLFAPASAELTEAGAERLTALADTIAAAYPGRTLRIEGHSDSVPVGGSLKEKYPTNWELSAARASAVVRALIAAHDLAPERFEVVALSDLHPVAPNSTAAGRRKNRRIDVYALPE